GAPSSLVLTVADFNGDGAPDVATGNQSQTPTISVLLDQTSSGADLSLTKSAAPNPVNAGANLTYTLTANNAGSIDATIATLLDPLPSGTTFQSLSAPGGWTCSTPAVGGTGTVSCSNPTFASSTNAVFTLVVKVNSSIPNGATIQN